MIQKEKYLAPQIEIIKMENEGVIATSGNLPSVGNGGSAYSSRARSTYLSETGFALVILYVDT